MKKTCRNLIHPFILMGLVFFFSCSKSGDNPQPSGTVTDIDGNVYHTVTISTPTGSQI